MTSYGMFLRNCLGSAAQTVSVIPRVRDVQTGLVQATLDARQEKAHVSKAALELLVVCAWLVHDVEQARGVATADDDDDDCGDETLKGGTFVEGRPARVLLRVKTRLNDIQKCLREHGAFADVETNVPDMDNKGA